MKFSPTLLYYLTSLLTGAAYMPVHAAEAVATTVVLVHGAFANGSSWDKVIPILQAKGLKVVAVHAPMTSLADDVAATERVVLAQSGKVVLVGHSWGGTVITQAGANEKIKALVYIAALAPSEGESTAVQGKNYPESPGTPTYQIDPSGFAYLPAESVAINFAQDLPLIATQIMTATQGPIRATAFGDVVTVAGWRSKPSYYIVAANDRMISPALEAATAKKIGATTTVLQSSHVAMLAQPEKVADVIIAASRR